MPALLSNATEPIAGYTLCEQIGSGGYGEVWRADAPGGLSKAIKFVYGKLDEERANCELKALNRIKEVRHPFLLSLERIEVVDGQLVIITELADMSLKDRFHQCRESGLPGIPRDELIVYLRDAADALDYMSETHSLQHLDVKPENLLIVGGRVKVADFGLVREIADKTVSLLGGMTPIYASPESFQGRPSRYSDQYSLAIVYQDMLTGILPFPGKSAVQLTSQHLHSRPRLTPLPAMDQAPIARALSKDPAERFSNCRELIEALVAAGRSGSGNDLRSSSASSGSASPIDTATIVAKGPSAPQSKQKPSDGSWVSANPPTLHGLSLADSSVGAADSLLAAMTPQPIVNLPPLESLAPSLRLRPTLFIGVGGTGARVLRQLHGRLQDRLGSLASVPTIELLLVDTDLNALSQATQGDEKSALSSRQTLGLPLRPPSEYREDSDHLLQWLSRRWLYNIPRSLHTEGVRPLGRLALVDHLDEFRKRLRTAVAAITRPEAVEASKRLLGCDECEAAPRVVLIASISGGTGSGMVLDAAYAARQVLDELGLPDEGLCGVLVQSAVRNPSAKDLAVANAYACLSEMRYYHARGYPGDPGRRLPQFDPGTSAFHDTYLLHLGSDLSEEQFVAAADELAAYLYLDAVTPSGRFFDACRQTETPADDEPSELRLRTFGLNQIGSTQSLVPAAATEALCRNLVERWMGNQEWQKNSPCPAAPVSGEPPAVENALPLDLQQLLKHVHSLFEQTLGGDCEEHFRAVLERQIASGDALKASAEQIVDTLNGLLGDRSSASDLSTASDNRLQAAMGLHLKDLATAQGTALCDWIAGIVDSSPSRVEGAHLASQWIGERLRALEIEADGQFKQQASRVSQLEQSLLEADASPRAKSRGWFGRSRAPQTPVLDDRWLEYVRIRLDQIALRGIGAVARALRAKTSALGDQLADLRRRLYVLAEQFQPVPFWDESEADDDVLSGASADPARQIAGLLHHRLPDLAAELDRSFQVSVVNRCGGLSKLLENEGDLHAALPARLRAAARSAVYGALQRIDFARLIFRNREGTAGADSFLAWLEAAQPRLSVCGGTRRLLLVCPEGPAGDDLGPLVAEQAGQGISVVRDSDVNLVLCSEMSDLPLARAAAVLLGGRPERAQIASRLHTRVDIAWTPLPPVR